MVNDACKDSFKRFTDEPALVCFPPSEDVNDEKEKQEVKNLTELTVKRKTRITPCLKNFKIICKESIFHSNKQLQVSSVFAITSTLPSIEPKDSLIMGDEHLSTFSAEKIVLIPRKLFACFLLHHDPSTPLKSVASILEGFIDNPLFEKNDDLFDLECKTNDWKRILYDAPIDEAECFDPGGTDISKIIRKPSKTGKHGHENGRVYKSRKPKPEKVKSTVNSSQNSLIKALIGSSKDRVQEGEHTHMEWGFVLFLLREEAQVSLTWIASLAIRVRSLSDPTAKA
ncbi:hypothetical protein Tco_0587075 [Tanacetum coccineum]